MLKMMRISDACRTIYVIMGTSARAVLLAAEWGGCAVTVEASTRTQRSSLGLGLPAGSSFCGVEGVVLAPDPGLGIDRIEKHIHACTSVNTWCSGKKLQKQKQGTRLA